MGAVLKRQADVTLGGYAEYFHRLAVAGVLCLALPLRSSR
jgi:hypothetical protein